MSLAFIVLLVLNALAPCLALAQDCCGQKSPQKSAKAINEVLNDYAEGEQFFADTVAQMQKSTHTVTIKQEDKPANTVHELLGPNYSASRNAGFFLMYRMPSDFRLNHKPKDSLSLDMSAANTMIHRQRLIKGDKSTQYRGDGVGQTWNLKGTKAIDSETEVSVSFALYHLNGGKTLMLRPVSDGFIETFHSSIGHEDPYGRNVLGHNMLLMEATDTDGNKVRIDRPTTFVLPVVFDLNRFQTLQQSENSSTTFKTGAHIGIPLDRMFGQLGLGLDCVIAHNHKVSDNYVISMAAGMVVQLQREVFGQYRSTERTDLSHHQTLSFAITRLDADRQGKTSLVTSVSQDSALLKGPYRATSQYRFTDRQAANAMTKADRNIEIALVREGKDWAGRVGVAEDFSGRKDNGKSTKASGLNHQDFKVFGSLNYRFY